MRGACVLVRVEVVPWRKLGTLLEGLLEAYKEGGWGSRMVCAYDRCQNQRAPPHVRTKQRLDHNYETTGEHLSINLSGSASA